MSRAGLLARVTVAENALKARLQAGLTQAQLLEKLGMPASANAMVSRWENGVTPLTVSRLAEIAQACEVPFAQLVEGV